MSNMYPNVKGDWRENLTLLNSVAYNELLKNPSATRLLKHLYFSNTWKKVGVNQKNWSSLNNGKIVCKYEKLKEKGLINSKGSYTKAVALIVTLGFAELTQYGGSRKPHIFKVLLAPACKKSEQKWRDYPNKDWKHKIPQKNKKLKGGEKTYLKNFAKPSSVGSKVSDKPNGVGTKSTHILSDEAQNTNNLSNNKPNGLGSTIKDTIGGEFNEPILIERIGSTEKYQWNVSGKEWIGYKKYHEDMREIKWDKQKNEKNKVH